MNGRKVIRPNKNKKEVKGVSLYYKNKKKMEYLNNRITVDASVCGGKPCIRGIRITAQTILEYLGAGDRPEEILKQYPSLEIEDIYACISFAAELMNHQYSVKAIA